MPPPTPIPSPVTVPPDRVDKLIRVALKSQEDRRAVNAMAPRAPTVGRCACCKSADVTLFHVCWARRCVRHQCKCKQFTEQQRFAHVLGPAWTNPTPLWAKKKRALWDSLTRADHAIARRGLKTGLELFAEHEAGVAAGSSGRSSSSTTAAPYPVAPRLSAEGKVGKGHSGSRHKFLHKVQSARKRVKQMKELLNVHRATDSCETTQEM